MRTEPLVDGCIGTFTQQLYPPFFANYHLNNIIYLNNVIHAHVAVLNIISVSRDHD